MKSEEFYLSDGGMTDERKDLLCYRTQGFAAEWYRLLRRCESIRLIHRRQKKRGSNIEKLRHLRLPE